MRRRKHKKSSPPSLRARLTAPHRRPLRFEPLEDRRLLSITVNTLVDENDGINVGGISLRDAIAAAAPGDTINFAASLTASGPATILLAHGELDITKSLTLSGPGANLLTIDASSNDPTPDMKNGDGSRIFNVDNGGLAPPTDVVINGLALTGGDVSGPGGGVLNHENLTIVSCVITHNSGSRITVFPLLTPGSGGGIANYDGDLILAHCIIEDNEIADSSGQGGGILDDGGSLFLSGTIVRNNSLAYYGGGIALANCDATIVDSEVLDNSVGGGFILQTHGAGIEAVDVNLRVIRTTIARNFGAVVGGGIDSIRGSLYLSQSTVADHFVISLSGLGFDGRGAGIYRDSQSQPGDTAHIWYSTITGNQNFDAGGGIYVTGAGPIYVSDSIVARNRTGLIQLSPDNNPIYPESNIFGSAVVQWSLISDNAHATISDLGGNIIGTPAQQIDPLLGALENNGGQVFLDGSRIETPALLPGAPAINQGDPAAVAGGSGAPRFDQRGTPFTRVAGGRIDMGAVEFQPNPLPGDYNFNGTVDAADYTIWRGTLGSTTDLRADSSGPTIGTPNGIVDQADFDFWRSHFGNTLAGSSAGTTAQSSNAESIPISAPATKTATQPPALPGFLSDAVQSSPPSSNPTLSNPQSEITNPQSTTHDSALLAWLTTQPQSELPIKELAATTSGNAIFSDDFIAVDESIESTDSPSGALELAFATLAVNP